jgi:hypothetical protein
MIQICIRDRLKRGEIQCNFGSKKPLVIDGS